MMWHGHSKKMTLFSVAVISFVVEQYGLTTGYDKKNKFPKLGREAKIFIGFPRFGWF